MGLFDKKYCSICGAEIGLLGNRKLMDGNLCKNCADKLSPLFDERRQSTVEDIRDQLAYRKENRARVEEIHPTRSCGANRKLYIDENAKAFFVTYSRNWQSENPDIIDFSQVMDCTWRATEHKDEIKYRSNDGKMVSYQPPRYKKEYEFDLDITVNSPYFQKITLELTEQRPERSFGPEYKQWEILGQEICDLLMGKPAVSEIPELEPPASATLETWLCSGCGRTNNTNYCPDCGQKRPEIIRCIKCGWEPDAGMGKPRFCPNCGNRFPD
ncbi:MAG: DUF4428 domain-containing protein [Clostridia bacterium]|nr:DUF4428 domain-containing protein [Clostridia bacterium]